MWLQLCVLLLFREEFFVYGVERVEVHCLSDKIQIDVTTIGEFEGVIYTQGSFRQPGCYLDAQRGRQFQIAFSLTDCNTSEQESRNYNNVLIIQHEDELITKDDFAFNILCDYNPRRKTLDLKTPLTFQPSNDNITDGNQFEDIPTAAISPKTLHVFGQALGQDKIKSNEISSSPNIAVLTVKRLKS